MCPCIYVHYIYVYIYAYINVVYTYTYKCMYTTSIHYIFKILPFTLRLYTTIICIYVHCICMYICALRLYAYIEMYICALQLYVYWQCLCTDKRRGIHRRHIESIYIQIYIYLYVYRYTECILATYICDWTQRNTSKTYRAGIHVNIIYMYVCIYTEFIYIVAVYLYEQTQRETYRVIIYICVHVYMYTTFILCTLAISQNE